jgi:hypothetical protein
MISKSRSPMPTLNASQAPLSASSTLLPVNSWYALSFAITYSLVDHVGRASSPNGSWRPLMQRGQAPFAHVVPQLPQQHPESIPASPLGNAGHG